MLKLSDDNFQKDDLGLSKSYKYEKSEKNV